ncbi:MAG: hypothetical protein ACI9K5_000450, partial [Gammaproteobacteria bacterium]
MTQRVSSQRPSTSGPRLVQRVPLRASAKHTLHIATEDEID